MLMFQTPLIHRVIGSVAATTMLLVCASLKAADPPADASFASSSDVETLIPPLTQFGTFRQGNPGTTLNFNVYNLGTASAISFAHTPTAFGSTSAISLQTAYVTGLQHVGAGGTPNAPMQLVASTSQVSTGQPGNLFQVTYILEFSSDSYPSAAHDSLTITGYSTVLRHGDYNADGNVDAGDYVVWRKTRGQSGLTPYTRADDNGDGLVTDTDYNAWRAAFTGASGSGASTPGSALSGPTTVPEPTSVVLCLAGASFVALLARRRNRTPSVLR